MKDENNDNENETPKSEDKNSDEVKVTVKDQNSEDAEQKIESKKPEEDEPADKAQPEAEPTEAKDAEQEEQKTDDAVSGETESKEKPEEIEPELTNEYRLPSSGSQKPLHHHSFKHLLIAAAVVLVLAFLAAGIVWTTHDNPVDTVENTDVTYSQGAALTAVEGDVEYSNLDGSWTKAESGMNLEESNRIRTLESSRAIITLDDGSAVRLNSNTTVTLTKLMVDEVQIDNDAGEVYVRVSPSETRKFYVYVDDNPYLALGTAFVTLNTQDTEGVEVFQSKVKTKDLDGKEKDVAEGQALYLKNSAKDKVNKIIKLDIEKLKDDAFLKWNKEKDASQKEFADQLGFLKDIDEPKKEDKNDEEKNEPATTPDGITASAVKVDDGIKVTWTVKNVDTSLGFKVAYSKTDTTPSYGEDSAKYVGAGESSFVLGLTDGKVWHIRVCAYRGEGQCDNYSNTVSATAPEVEKYQVDSGSVYLNTIGTDGTVSWSIVGTAPYGYKVVYGTNSDNNGPEYPGRNGTDDKYIYIDKESVKTATLSGLTSGATYYVRVCKYNPYGSEKCIIYSNQETYAAP